MTSGETLDASVVLPTYNESASLPVLIPRIARALEAAGVRGEIIVVDDNSPDDTAKVAEELGKQYPVRVKKRVTERGLATAVIAGFDMSEAQVCVVMDADGSHPVEALGDMIKLILADKAEIVVGSRHAPGGGSKDWPLFSQFKSRFAASLAFALTSMTDPTTGFMAIRRARLEGLTLDPVGWKIVLETVVKAQPARVAEVPIVFTDREHGESKQSLRVLGQYLEHLYKLYEFRFPALVELFKFCLVGALGVIVDLSAVSLLKHFFALDTRLCQVFGFSAAVSVNYAINRRYSFKEARNTPLLYSYVAYVAANMLGLAVRMVAIQLLMRMTELDRGQGYLLLSVIGIGLATLVNFVGVKYFAFAPERLRPEAASEDDVERAPTGPARMAALAVAVLSLALVGAALFRAHELSHDELVNLTMAANIRAGSEGFVHPSVTPGVPLDWQRDALPNLGNTPIYPALLALGTSLGRAGLLGVGVLTWLLALAGSLLSLRALDRTAARSALMLFAASPALVSAYALYEFEPLVAALGVLGFAALTRTGASNNALYSAFSGLALGLAFTVKMWLVTPALFACIAFALSRTYHSAPEQRAVQRRAFAVFAACFALAGSAHLAFVALTSPGDLRAWINGVYLALFEGRGPSGAKLTQAGPAARSPFAYLIWLVRDHGALFVPLALGLPAATRRLPGHRSAWFSAALGALMALVPLSVPAGKEPLYMLPALPFLYMVVGLALASPERVPERHARVNRGAAQASLLLASLLVAAHLVAYGLDDQRSLAALLLRVSLVAVWTVPSLGVLRARAPSSLLLPCALASLGLCAVQVFAGL